MSWPAALAFIIIVGSTGAASVFLVGLWLRRSNRIRPAADESLSGRRGRPRNRRKVGK